MGDQYEKAKDIQENAPHWKKSLAKELMKNTKKRFPRRRVYSPGVDAIWAADLLVIKKYEKKNKHMKYILVLVDLFSKKAWARGLVNKTGLATAKALEDVFNTGDKPGKLWVDEGKEFYNSNVKKLLTDNNIEIYSTHNTPKSCIAERFIRTIRRKVEEFFILSHSTQWVYILPKLISDYNHTKHSSIGATPEDARKKENFKKVYHTLYAVAPQDDVMTDAAVKRRLPMFHVGDKVRISVYKRVFEKSSTATYSEEIFIVDQILYSTPITYKLRDFADEKLDGGLYHEQLQKTDADIYRIDKILKKRKQNGKDEVYVKWNNWPEKFNSWEPEENIQKSGEAVASLNQDVVTQNT